MSNKVTYNEIIEALSRETDFSKQKCEVFAKALVNRIIDELEDTGKASITNFGSFTVKEVAERQGQNPQTGEPITIPAHKRVSFTPYKALKEEVNAKFAHLETELLGEKSEKSGTQKKEQEKEKQEEKKDEEKAESIFQFDEKEVEVGTAESPHKKEEEPQPKVKSLRKEKEPGSGKIFAGILIALLVTAFVIWFLMRPTGGDITPEQAATEEPKPPETPGQIVGAENELQPDQVAEDTTEQESSQREMSAASKQTQKPAQQTSTQPSASEKQYEVGQNEWHWVIAEKVYGEPEFWPLIYQANFTINDHPDSLKKSVGLTIPEFEGSPENPTKADYQRLAAATSMVSDAYKKAGRADKAEEYARFAKRWEKRGM